MPLGNLDGWKRLIEVVPSPSNGLTWDSGMTRELGEIRMIGWAPAA